MDEVDKFARVIKTANPDFWVKNSEKFVTSAGLTPGFSRELGESLFYNMKSVRTPYYNTFKGRPLTSGAAWKERIMALPGIERFKPKASAEDAFKFYESEGLEEVHAMDYQGWIPLSVPSDLELGEMVQNPGKIGEFARFIHENGALACQMGIDALIGKKIVSCVEHTEEVDTTDYDAMRKLIRDTATEMRTNKGTYASATVDTDKFLTSAEEVLVIMEESTYNDMIGDLASYPSPDKFVQNATIMTVPEMHTPITTAEYTTGVTANGWDEDYPPANVNGGKPTMIIMSKDWVEYRPYMGESRVNLNANGAGDFTNAHILFKGSIGIRGWEQAVAVYPEAPAAGTP